MHKIYETNFSSIKTVSMYQKKYKWLWLHNIFSMWLMFLWPNYHFILFTQVENKKLMKNKPQVNSTDGKQLLQTKQVNMNTFFFKVTIFFFFFLCSISATIKICKQRQIAEW